MAYSDNFPPQRAVFTLDAANAGRLDPRCSFTRASTGSYFGTAKHLSSENLIPNSNVSQAWEKTNTLLTTSGSFLNGSDSHLVSESSATGSHYIAPNVGVGNSTTFTIGTEYTVVLYAKSGTDNVIQLGMSSGAFGTNAYANYDLSNASTTPVTGSAATATITAMGSDWVKLTLTATATATQTTIGVYVGFVQNDINGARIPSYAGDTASNVYLWEANVSSTGQKFLVETDGSIHRAYASTLQTAASGAARFEYDPTDGQSGAKGLLVEGQSQNLISYSSDSTQWAKAFSSATGSAAVAPDGSLSATAWVPDTSLNGHYTHPSSLPTVASGTTYTGSVYVKSAGLTLCQLTWSSAGFGAGYKVNFNLAGSGSVVATAGGASGTISQCGDGWFRLTITAAATSSGSGVMVIGAIDSESSGRLPSYSGDGYNGLLIWQLQQETGSFASSAISTSGAAATRAADSLSVATADIPGFSEGVGTIVCETGGVASSTATNQTAFGLNGPASSNLFSAGVNNGGVTDSTVRVYSQTPDGDQAFLNPGTATVGTGYKLAVRYELDNIAASMNGGAVVSDTNGKVPVGIDTLWVGELEGNYHLNSNLKRIALYSEALSDTNLQAITS